MSTFLGLVVCKMWLIDFFVIQTFKWKRLIDLYSKHLKQLLMNKLLFISTTLFLFVSPNLFSQWNDAGTNIRTNDNVGIGLNPTNQSFYVRKNQTGWQSAFVNRGGAGSSIYIGHGAGYGMHIRGHTTDGKYTLDLYNKVARTNIFFNNGNVGLGLVGKVGVGTSRPSGKLTVHSAATESGIESVNPNGNSHFPYSNGYSYLSGKGIVFRSNGNIERMRIETDGSVVIGNVATPNTDYKLFVEKGILAEKVRVAVKSASDWADNVFEAEYSQLPINEVDDFISENKHLPNVPSADEVVKDGIDLAKMDAILLRQIEELWLHVIELTKENEELRDQINN